MIESWIGGGFTRFLLRLLPAARKLNFLGRYHKINWSFSLFKGISQSSRDFGAHEEKDRVNATYIYLLLEGSLPQRFSNSCPNHIDLRTYNMLWYVRQLILTVKYSKGDLATCDTMRERGHMPTKSWFPSLLHWPIRSLSLYRYPSLICIGWKAVGNLHSIEGNASAFRPWNN